MPSDLISTKLICVLTYWKFYLTCQSEFCHSLVGAATTASENEICTIFCVLLLCAKFWVISLRKDKGGNEKELKSYRYLVVLGLCLQILKLFNQFYKNITHNKNNQESVFAVAKSGKTNTNSLQLKLLCIITLALASCGRIILVWS